MRCTALSSNPPSHRNGLTFRRCFYFFHADVFLPPGRALFPIGPAWATKPHRPMPHLSRAALTSCLSVHHGARNRCTPSQSEHILPTVCPPLSHPVHFLPLLIKPAYGFVQFRQISITPECDDRRGRRWLRKAEQKCIRRLGKGKPTVRFHS